MHDMKKVLGKKDKSENPVKKEAKLSALKGLRDEMSNMMQGDLGQKMNKVVVAAKDKQGLEKGLDKAKEVLDTMPDNSAEEQIEEETGEDVDNDAEVGESDEHQDKVISHMSEEEIDEMMQKLIEMKKQLSSK